MAPADPTDLEMRLGPGLVRWKEGVWGGALVPGSQVLWQEKPTEARATDGLQLLLSPAPRGS